MSFLKSLILLALLGGIINIGSYLATASTDLQTTDLRNPSNQAETEFACKRHIQASVSNEAYSIYYACEQAKAARDLADTIKSIEKKLPNFNEF